ncbi:hypothetical protein CMUS01_11242 [Colletotrichum musicola]|uniref:Uncharacterized protein n=1 Tax=Colletotrichum musicola TaxID=2175873 RepID=A0A8H6JYY1_9PEZI|nr:hypothetical protein CMUS01_11242 [Colletotrichum musicola]
MPTLNPVRPPPSYTCLSSLPSLLLSHLSRLLVHSSPDRKASGGWERLIAHESGGAHTHQPPFDVDANISILKRVNLRRWGHWTRPAERSTESNPARVAIAPKPAFEEWLNPEHFA